MSDPVSKRRWFRFSLRTLFVVVAVFGAWLAYEVNWIRQRHDVLARCIAASRSWHASDPPTKAPQLHWLFGEAGYADIYVGFQSDSYRMLNATEEAEMERIRALFPEAQRILGHALGPLTPPVPQESK